MEKEPKRTIEVNIYKEGKPTGETEVLNLDDPEVARKLEESLQKQDGEFD